MKRFVLIAIAMCFATIASPETTTKQIECYCTDKTGSRVELGETRCMEISGRRFTARCEMSLNNPMWRELSEDCLTS